MICHADIHAWNVLVTPDGDIVIVDWDSAMLAPRERDLMFVDGVAGGHAADPAAFFDGYGDVELDPIVLAYYRIEWAVQDLAEFSASVFLDPDAGEDTKADAVERIVEMFAPGNEIDIVTRAPRPRVIDHGSTPRSYSAATFFGTTIRHASSTSSRISVRSIAASLTSTQWNRMSDGRGMKNFSGSAATNASRSSFGNPKPISVSSRENAKNTI